MSKARITYRFDRDEHLGHAKPHRLEQDDAKVIPLFHNEYNVIDEKNDALNEKNDVLNEKTDERIEKFEKHTTDTYVDENLLNPYMTDYGAWKSPVDLEIERLEQLIRSSNGRSDERSTGRSFGHSAERPAERPAERTTGQPTDRTTERPAERPTVHSTDRTFERPTVHPSEWTDKAREWAYEAPKDDHNDGMNQPPIYDDRLIGPSYRRHPRTTWLKVVASVFGAVATGLIFGFFVLSLFSRQNTDLMLNNNADVTPTATINSENLQMGTDQFEIPTEGTMNTDDGIADHAANESRWVDVNVAGMTMFVLQNGVFSNVEGADKAMADLKLNGLAAAQVIADKYYVYTGISPNRDDVLVLANILQDLELETYIKQLDVPVIGKLRWGEIEPEVLQQYFMKSNQLLSIIGEFSSEKLSDGSLPTMDKLTAEMLANEHIQWTDLMSKATHAAVEAGKPFLQTMNHAMNTAVAALGEYEKRPSETYLWHAQTALMNYIFTELQLLKAMSPN